MTIQLTKNKEKKRFFPIDLKAALKDGWKPVDEKLDTKALIAEIDENLKKYLPKKKVKKD